MNPTRLENVNYLFNDFAFDDLEAEKANLHLFPSDISLESEFSNNSELAIISLSDAIERHSVPATKRYCWVEWQFMSQEKREETAKSLIANFDPVELADICSECPTKYEELFYILIRCVELQYNDLAAYILNRVLDDAPEWFTAEKRVALFLKGEEYHCSFIKTCLLAENAKEDLMEAFFSSELLFTKNPLFSNKTLIEWIYESTDFFSSFIDAAPFNSKQIKEVVRFCLNKGEDEAAVELLKQCNNLDVPFCDEILLRACRSGYAAIVSEILNIEMDVNIVDLSNGLKTPLMYAAERGWRSITKQLVQNGADMWAIDATRKSAFQYIINTFNNDRPFVSNLLASYPIERINGYLHLMSMIKYQENDYLLKIIDKLRTYFWWNPATVNELYFTAFKSGNSVVMEKLLPQIFPLSAGVYTFSTPLFMVIDAGRGDLVAQMIQVCNSCNLFSKVGTSTPFQKIVQRLPNFFSKAYLLLEWDFRKDETFVLIQELAKLRNREAVDTLVQRLEACVSKPQWYNSKAVKDIIAQFFPPYVPQAVPVLPMVPQPPLAYQIQRVAPPVLSQNSTTLTTLIQQHNEDKVCKMLDKEMNLDAFFVAGTDSLLKQAAQAKLEKVVLQLLGGQPAACKRLFLVDATNKRNIDYIAENFEKSTIEKIVNLWDCRSKDTCDFISYLIANDLQDQSKALLTMKRFPGKRRGFWEVNDLSKLFIVATEHKIRMRRFIRILDPYYVNEGGTTPLISIIQAGWIQEFRSFIKRGVDFSRADSSGVSAIKHLSSALTSNKRFAKNVLASWNLRNLSSCKLLLELLDVDMNMASNLLESLGDIPIKDINWDTKEILQLFVKAVEKKNEEIATGIIPLVPIGAKQSNKSLVLFAAEKKLFKVVKALIAHGEALSEIESNNETLLEKLQRIFTAPQMEEIISQVPVGNPRNQELVLLLFRLKRNKNALAICERERTCENRKILTQTSAATLYGAILEQKDFITAKGLIHYLDAMAAYKNEYLFVRTCTTLSQDLVRQFLSILQPYGQLYKYKTVMEVVSTYFKDTKPEFVAEVVKANNDYFNTFEYLLKNCQIEPTHMRYTFKNNKQFDVLPMPTAPGFSLSTALEEIIKYIDSSWSNDLLIQDDKTSHAKSDIIQVLRSFVGKLEQGTAEGLQKENQVLLQKMYGNIFYNILQLIHKSKDNDLKIRSFIQSCGVTLYHCSDRKITDSIRYYRQFVEYQSVSEEEHEADVLLEKVHQALFEIRVQLFDRAYFSVDTDQHDAATHRDLSYLLNEEFGLHLPPFSDRDGFENYSIKEKYAEVKKAFLERYTPLYIARTLSKVIQQSIEDQKTRNQPQQWYSAIINYLQNTDPSLDLSTVYDLETNAFTNAIIKMLLVNLKIIK